VLGALVLGVRRSSSTRRRSRRDPVIRELGRGLAFVRRSPLLRWMTLAAVAFSLLFFSLYLPFAQAATNRYTDPDALAGFLGLFWASVTGAAFVVSIVFANRLLGWIGAAAVLLVLPGQYMGAFGFLLASSAFTTIVAVRFAVTLWLQGVCSPAWETLVNVVPESRRAQVRAFLNGGPTQVGTAIAGVIALVGQEALSRTQLAAIGLAVSGFTIFVAWRIRRSYGGALVEALRAGRPSLFEGPALGVPVAVDRDVQAVSPALDASRDADPRVRRLATEMLAGATDERAGPALAHALEDADPLVRSNAVRGLAALGEHTLVVRALDDPDPDVRLSAVLAFGADAAEPAPTSLLYDPDVSVSAAAAVALLPRPEATERIRELLHHADIDVRVEALVQLRRAGPDDIASFATAPAGDPSAAVRSALLETLSVGGAELTIRPAIDSLADPDVVVRNAALEALAILDLGDHRAELRQIVDEHASLASADRAFAASIPSDGDASELLRDAVVERGRRHALVAFSALSLTSPDRSSMQAAFGNLDASDGGQLANALETLEVAADARVVRPLIGLWEPAQARTDHPDSTGWLERAAADPDPFVRACAELVQRVRQRKGASMPGPRTSMSEMERMLELRKIPLFAALTPTDLHRVAGIAEERTFAQDDVIAGEGEAGDELHVVVEGYVRVERGGWSSSMPVARRGPGDVVGEMSIITRSPRMASLVADGDVRTIRIGHREFESMIRERPDVALAVMRVLAERLGAESTGERRREEA